MEKLCVFCEHLEYEPGGTGDYAEPAELYCNKKHKLLCDEKHFQTQGVYDIDDFRRMIKTAENCADYKPPNAALRGGEAVPLESTVMQQEGGK